VRDAKYGCGTVVGVGVLWDDTHLVGLVRFSDPAVAPAPTEAPEVGDIIQGPEGYGRVIGVGAPFPSTTVDQIGVVWITPAPGRRGVRWIGWPCPGVSVVARAVRK
jgi:hypothetical protein